MLSPAETSVLESLGGSDDAARKRRGDLTRFREVISPAPLDQAQPEDVRRFLKLFKNYTPRNRALNSLRSYYQAAGRDITAGISAIEEKATAIRVSADPGDADRLALLLMLAAHTIPKEVLGGTLHELKMLCNRDPRLHAAFEKINGQRGLMFPWDDQLPDEDRLAFPDGDRLRWILEAAGYDALMGSGTR